MKTKIKKVKVVKEKKVRAKPNLKSTPQEMIDSINAEFTDWKTTKQVRYDKDGKRMG